MKFLKLMDPWDTAGDCPRVTFAEQAKQATLLFPKLADEPPFHYWKAKQPIEAHQERILLGIALYDLVELRLLDLLKSTLEVHPTTSRLDLCNINDTGSCACTHECFPELPQSAAPPFLGIWKEGQHVQTLAGGAAVEWVLERFELAINASEIVHSVRPPSPELLE